MSTEPQSLTASAVQHFAPTRWTVVLAAKGETFESRAALEKLCQTYWPPIYAFIRRQGKSPHDAQDLTQEFFARLLGKNYLEDVDRTKGKFRSFLLSSVKHFLANEWHKANAQKRGGGKQFISINEKAAESASGFDLPDHMTAETIFERRWAMTLLDQTLNRLRDEYVDDGKSAFFEKIKGTLTGESALLPYAQLAKELGTSEGNIKVAVHRLRARYRELLREEIAETVSSPNEIEGELRSLFAALGG